MQYSACQRQWVRCTAARKNPPKMCRKIRGSSGPRGTTAVNAARFENRPWGTLVHIYCIY